MLRILFSLLCVKCIFVWFCQSVRLEVKKGITSAMECLYLATFTFATWQIRSCLLCNFISPGASLFGFPSIFRIYSQKKWIVELFYWSQFRDRKESELFASQAKNALKHARTTSLGWGNNLAAFTLAAWQIRSWLLRHKCQFLVYL